MREGGQLSPLKLDQLVTLLRLRCWLVTLGRLHVGHYLLHGLQHLCTHYEHLLQHWWGWRVALIVVIGIDVMVPRVGHLRCRGVHEI
jgi:hypothetical protein